MRTYSIYVFACIVGASYLHSGAESTLCADEKQSGTPQRVQNGLLVIYDFSSDSGPTVKDLSGVGSTVDLRIGKANAIGRKDGTLAVRNDTLLRTSQPANKITAAIRRSGEITIEAWIRPADTNQSGPARIVTLSRNGTNRSFTLGQDGDRYDVRFRTTQTSANGLPSLSSPPKTVTDEVTHVVYARRRSGQAKLYVDGESVAESEVDGSTSNWDESYRLGLANEFSNDRPWRGTYYLVALYRRALTPREVQQNFRAGANARAATHDGSQAVSPTDHVFTTKVAPLLANHCLECHDTATQESELDLSRKQTALAGGELGKAIIPGKPGESLLWELVEADDMPLERPPLTAEQKKLLHDWIASGAHWTLDQIDAATYAHGEQIPQNWIRRLTIPEYVATVRATVGVDIEQEAYELLPPDLRADGFTNTAYNLNIDLKHIGAYSRLAEIIVDRMDVKKFARRFSNRQRLIDDDMRGLIAKMGKWILRGPLDEHEIDDFRGISTTVASAGGNFETAVRYILEAMLQSPRFMYRIENQRGDGTAWQVGEYELASRISYIVWGAPPDRELIEAAEAGELFDDEALKVQLKRMLADRRAVERSKQFAGQWLNLGHLSNMRPSKEKFPDWNPLLAKDMQAETLAFFEEVVWKQQRPLAELFNAQFTYVTPRLAAHYNLPTPQRGDSDAQGEADQLVRYDLEDVPGRGGLLTHGSVLTVGGDDASMVSTLPWGSVLTVGGDDASMVTRGLFVLHDVLRGVVKDPPPCVDTTPVPTKPGLTQRKIAERRIADVSCGGCHGKFEPLAFGLEKFDGLGSFHEKDEHGNELRDDGQVTIPGLADKRDYNSSAELMEILAGSDRVRQTLTWKLTQFALGRPLVAQDVPIVNKIHETAFKNGGTYTDTVTAIVTSDLVLTTYTETE